LGHHICLSVCLKAQGSDPDVRKSTKDRRILAELSGGENDTESWSRERNPIASSASFGDWNVDENDCKETRRRYVASRREVLSRCWWRSYGCLVVVIVLISALHFFNIIKP
jgi:hypothetical protein